MGPIGLPNHRIWPVILDDDEVAIDIDHQGLSVGGAAAGPVTGPGELPATDDEVSEHPRGVARKSLGGNRVPIPAKDGSRSNEEGGNTVATAEEPLTQQEADSREIARLIAEGKRVTDPELRRRVRERAAAITQEIFEKHGLVEWAVEMTREARGE